MKTWTADELKNEADLAKVVHEEYKDHGDLFDHLLFCLLYTSDAADE